jgi:pimeloyl-ACP methyl ester carboxylesterase
MPPRIAAGEVFDRSGQIRRPPIWFLLREVAIDLTYLPPAPSASGVPDGRGHVVLVIPAFLTTDRVTRHLRRFLQSCGYRSFGWGLGVNWGPTERLATGLRRRLAELRVLAGHPVSVIGLSLGGVLARDLAYDAPHDVRQVITIASPFNLPTATPLEPLVRLAACFFRPAIDVSRLASPLPVRSTAIFTRDDGLVAWQSCRRDDDNGHAVEVAGPHLTICRNPDVLRTVALALGPP